MARRTRDSKAARRHPTPDGTRGARRFPAWVVPVLLALVSFAVYAPSLYSGFVSDARLEIDEGFVTSLGNLPDLFSLRTLSMPLMLSDRPGEMLYLMLNAAVWGKDPFGFHLGSNLLHAANVALLFILLRRLLAKESAFRERGGAVKAELAAATAALLFALHPMATESVSEVSFSSCLLVAFFTLLALLAADSFHPEQNRTALVAGGVGLGCVFAAVATKESGLAAAALLVVYWFLYRRREAWKPWLLFLGSAVAITVIILAVIFHSALSRQMKLDYLGGSLSQVFLIQPQIWVFMLGQLAWPTHLSMAYDLADMALPPVPLSFAVLLALVALQAWLAWHSRLGTLGVAAYWVGLSTVSNIIPLYCFVADRFYYLPMAGLALQLTALLLMLQRSPRGFQIALACGVIALVPLTILTVQRQAIFTDEFTLYRETAKLSPHSSFVHNSLALAYFQRGQLDQAAGQYEETLQFDPKNSCAYVSLGVIHLRQGDSSGALDLFRKALEIDPTDDDAHCSLGMALCQMGRFDEGIAHLRQALTLDPTDVTAQDNLGLALEQQGQPEQAMTEFQAAVALAPNSSQAHYHLGNAYAREGQWAPAIAEFRKVVEAVPDNVEALTNLGVALTHDGQFEQAVTAYRAALHLRPDSPDLHDNLGTALAQKGDLTAAISEFQEALRLNPDFTAAQANLERARGALDKNQK